MVNVKKYLTKTNIVMVVLVSLIVILSVMLIRCATDVENFSDDSDVENFSDDSDVENFEEAYGNTVENLSPECTEYKRTKYMPRLRAYNNAKKAYKKNNNKMTLAAMVTAKKLFEKARNWMKRKNCPIGGNKGSKKRNSNPSSMKLVGKNISKGIGKIFK